MRHLSLANQIWIEIKFGEIISAKYNNKSPNRHIFILKSLFGQQNLITIIIIIIQKLIFAFDSCVATLFFVIIIIIIIILYLNSNK